MSENLVIRSIAFCLLLCAGCQEDGSEAQSNGSDAGYLQTDTHSDSNAETSTDDESTDTETVSGTGSDSESCTTGSCGDTDGPPPDTGNDLGTDTLSAVTSGAYGENPIVQTLYTADPAPMVYNDRLYVYTTHDEDTLVGDFFTMNDWRVYSTTDMVNWTDHGSPLAYTDFGWSNGSAWAAQCTHRNGKFYLYVPITQKKGGTAIGVAVSDSPTGPFEDALGFPLLAGGGYIDPTVFVDDDGQAYLYWGNPNLRYVRLNEDMISYAGEVEDITLTPESFGARSVDDDDRPSTYEEGPWFYKRDGLYYMVFAGGPISEHIGYSTSPSPIGPWTYRGVVMPTQGSSFTNHPGVVDYKGKSYLFYHNGALPGGGGYHRSVCAEEFEYNADGTIPSLNMTTSHRAGVGSLNPYVRVEAETMEWAEGVETETCTEGGMNLGFINDGDHIRVGGVNFGDGAAAFEARVASGTTGGTIELHLDSPTDNTIATCAVSGTGGWQDWTTVSCDVQGAEGIHDLYLVFKGSADYLFNFDWWRFQD